MTWLATSSENCKNENVTHICIQEVTVYHCTLLVLSKQKSVFCCQSNGSAANPIWTAFGRRQGTKDTASLRHKEDEALCSPKKKKSYCQDSLYPTGSCSGSYWNKLEVWLQATRGGRECLAWRAGTRLCRGKGFELVRTGLWIRKLLSSRWYRIHLQGEKNTFSACMDITSTCWYLSLYTLCFNLLFCWIFSYLKDYFLDLFIPKRITLQNVYITYGPGVFKIHLTL